MHYKKKKKLCLFCFVGHGIKIWIPVGEKLKIIADSFFLQKLSMVFGATG